MALGVPAVAVLGAPTSAGAATTAAASTDPLGPTVAQVDELVATVLYYECVVGQDVDSLEGPIAGYCAEPG
jgi:hypothetical protein